MGGSRQNNGGRYARHDDETGRRMAVNQSGSNETLPFLRQGRQRGPSEARVAINQSRGKLFIISRRGRQRGPGQQARRGE